jgi:hypothetical protein
LRLAKLFCDINFSFCDSRQQRSEPEPHLTRKPELKPQLARMTLIENDLETNIASKSEAGAINETRLTSVKSAKSAVLISEFGFNPSVNL